MSIGAVILVLGPLKALSARKAGTSYSRTEGKLKLICGKNVLGVMLLEQTAPLTA
jgi:hypothetical protein